MPRRTSRRRQEILADRIRGEVDPSSGMWAGRYCCWARARDCRIGVVLHPGAHLRDHLVNTHATPVEQHPRPSPEPVIVRSHPVDEHRRCPIRHTEPEDLVVSEPGRSGRLHGNPGVDREDARHDTAGAAITWITASWVVAGSGAGESPVGSRRAWCHCTPPRASGKQTVTSTGARNKTSRSNAAPNTR